MVKKILSASLISAMFIFSGCDTDSQGVDKLSSQQELDRGNYSSVISTLESKANKTDEDNMVLASAYMGKAGFSFSDNVAMIGDATSGNSDNTFSNFASDVQNKKQKDSLDNIQKAIDAYSAVGTSSNTRSVNRAEQKNNIGDKDLFLGLAYITKATLVLSYLGDTSKLSDGEGTDNELLASNCAIAKVYSNTLLDNCNSVTFDNETIKIILDNGNGVTYKRRTNTDHNQVILTDYKDNNLTAILIKNAPATIQVALVDTLNNAFDTLLKTAPQDVQDDITEFKKEIANSSGKVTTTTVSNYISKNN